MTKYFLLLILLLEYIAYHPLNRRTSKYYWKSDLDAYIPYISIFIVPYLSFVPFLAYSVIALWPTVTFVPFIVTLILAKAVALTFWYLVPNGVKREERKEKTFFDRITNYVYAHDGDTNAFPSSHVLTSLVIAYYLAVQFPALAPIYLGIGILITISTVFVKQHYVVDILGGAATFIVAVAVYSGLSSYFSSIWYVSQV